jgi:hypothetical protein
VPTDLSEKILDLELQQQRRDGMKRVYIDYFEEDSDGSGVKYKGQWYAIHVMSTFHHVGRS